MIEKIIETKERLVNLCKEHDYPLLEILPIHAQFNYKAYRDYYKNGGTKIYVKELEEKTLQMTERWLRIYGGKK